MKPTTQMIAIELVDGSVAIMQFVTVARMGRRILWKREATDDAVLAEIGKTGLPAVSFKLVTDNDLPADRTFRDAWRKGDGARIDVHMPTARDIHRQRLREVRAPLLAALDLEQMRALETGKGPAAVAARKQALRDVTKDPAIEAAQTPEELAAVIPAALATGG